MSMPVRPGTAKVTNSPITSDFHLRTRTGEGESGLDRMRDCLAVAFPPAGQVSVPAVRGLPGETGLTELSFGCSVPARVPQGEQRAEARERLSVYRVAAIRSQSGEALCLIRNISSGGLMGTLPAKLVPGEAVTLEIRSGSLIAAHVAWFGDGLVGIAFDDRINVLDVLQASVDGSPGLSQRMPRIRISCPVGIIAGDARQQATLADISQGGIKLHTEMLHAGEAVQVTVQGLDPRRGIVRWVKRGCAGIAFLNPIPFDVLAHWAAERQDEYRAALAP